MEAFLDGVNLKEVIEWKGPGNKRGPDMREVSNQQSRLLVSAGTCTGAALWVGLGQSSSGHTLTQQQARGLCGSMHPPDTPGGAAVEPDPTTISQPLDPCVVVAIRLRIFKKNPVCPTLCIKICLKVINIRVKVGGVVSFYPVKPVYNALITVDWLMGFRTLWWFNLVCEMTLIHFK